jgi:DNA (cytosine-5)-methyltransferase 1
MHHYGDITKINGAKVPVTDCIIFGAPCQDLSVAGKRAGMKHGDLGDEEATRSGLFMEAVRIIKEMRAEDEHNGRSGVDIRPRYGVYENVPGAFSSNKGEDFRIVLEELAKVKDPNAVIPMPEKWTNHGCIVGDGWSIAWRVLDAQFWGVPQRRRRIALVADFGGQSAPEILFVSQSVSGDIEPSESKRKETASDASRGVGADDRLGADQYNAVILGDSVSTLGVNCGMSHGRQCVLEPITFEPGIASREGGHIYEGVSGTLRANAWDNQMATAENHPGDSRVGINEDGKVQTLKSRMGTGGGNVPMVLALDRASFNQGKNAQYDFEVSDKGVNSPIVAKGPSAVCYTVDQGGGKSGVDVREGKAPTLTTTHDGAPAVCYPEVAEGIVGTLDAHYSNFPGMRGGMERTMVFGKRATRYISPQTHSS